MPQAIPFIAAAVAKYFGLTALQTAFAVAAASTAAGMYEQKRAKQKARDAYNKSLQDRIFPVRSGIAPRNYVCGTVRTSGAVMYIEPIGAKQQALDIVMAVANNECQLDGWFLNEDFISVGGFPGAKYGLTLKTPRSQEFTVTGTSTSVSLAATPNTALNAVHVTWRQAGNVGTASAASGGGTIINVTGLPVGVSTIVVSYTGAEAQSLAAQFQTGTESQASTTWSLASPGWTADHRLRGVCNTRTLFTWDENLYQSGAPAVGVLVTGRAMASHLLYDPRTGTNPASTKNPALLAGWWMTLPRNKGGCGIPSTWIDWQSIAAAANVCDETVTFKNPNGVGYSTGARYQANCLLSTDDAPLVNLETILSAMAGRRAFTGGLYKIVAGAFRPATLTITDADVIGTQPMSTGNVAGEDSPPNIVTATFADAAQNWIESPPRVVRNSAYVTADGHEEPLDLTLPATTDGPRANYLMGVALEGSRPAMVFSLSLGGVAENLAIYDTVQFSLVNRSVYSGKTFELIEISENWNGTSDCTFAEIRPQTWALDPDTYTPVNPVTPVDLSYLWNPSPVSGFTVAAITPQTLPDGTALMRVDLAWDPLPDAGNSPTARVELRYRVAGGDWIGIASVPGDAVGSTITAALIDGEVYQFQARYMNGVGAASAWRDYFTQISGTPLPAPLSLRIRASSTIFRVPQTGNALPLSINLDAIKTAGLSAPSTFTTNPPGITLGGSGDNRTLANSALGANESVQVTCTVTQSAIDYIDTVTILKVFDGADADSDPDPTTPPVPTGLAVQSFLVNLLASWTPAAYTVGHGHDATIVYAAQRLTAGPNPTFVDAVAVGSSNGNSYQFAAAPGTSWAIWIRFQSRDGYLSPVAGGTNGVQQTTAQIGTTNLGPLIIEAGNLANGAVTGAKLVSGAVDATKFASGIEPVTVVSSVPGVFITRAIFNLADNKLYHWTSGGYVNSIPAADIAGQLTAAQIQSIAAAQLTGLISGTQIGPNTISTGNLAAGSVTTAVLAANSVLAGNIAAGQITTPKLAAGAVTANELAANSVIAGKIAAGAITANEIAAGAITTGKLAITGKGAALNDDPAGIDITAWVNYPGLGVPVNSAFNIPVSVAPGGTVIRATGQSDVLSRQFPIITGKRYRASCWARKTSGTGAFYFGVLIYQPGAAGSSYTASFYAANNVTLSGSFQRLSGVFDTPPNHTAAVVYFTANNVGTGVTDIADLRCEEVIPGELIVDGSITARKLLITGGGGALNDDPQTTDITAWTYSDSRFTIVSVTDMPGITSVIRSIPTSNAVQPFSRPVAFNPEKTYRVRCRARSVGANGIFYLTVDLRDSSNQIIAGDGGYWLYNPSAISLPGTFTQYEGKFGFGTSKPFPSNARTMSVGALLNYNGNAGYHEITDLLIEECVDSGLIVDGSIQATHLAANSIAVGTAAIQNGAIVNAMIGNAAIDNAKILNLQVDKLTAGTLGADINVGAGHIVFDNGVILRAQGTGFGTSNQFIDWYGPRPPSGNINLCAELGAYFFLRVTPGAHFGGTLSAGTLKVAAQTPESSATATVSSSPFTTNGGAKTVVLSYEFHRFYDTQRGTPPTLAGGSAQIVLEKSLNGGSSWTTLTTLNVSGSEIVDSVEDPGVGNLIYTMRLDMGGSQTITDTQGATNNLMYRARIASRTLPAQQATVLSTDITQLTGFISQE